MSEPQPSALRHFTPVLLFALLVFSVVFVAPYVAREMQYALTRGELQAKSDHARSELAAGAGGRSPTSEAFRLAAMSVGPAVVQVRIERSAVAATATSDGPPTPEMPRAQGDGSGVIIDPAGYILTNDHVVESASSIEVRLADGRVRTAQVVGRDALTDLAVLKIEASGLTAAPWGESEALEVGDWVLAMGSPFGLDRSVTAGIVSAKGRRNVINNVPYQDFLQTDAAVNPGNSGGPLVNLQGHVVGINTAIFGKVFQGISFAIPSAMAKNVYERLKNDGQVRRAWLGVALAELDRSAAERLRLESPVGALITEVRVGNPAQKAGLRVGDVITSWDQIPIRDPMELKLKVADTPIAKEVDVIAWREGKAETFRVKVEERPAGLER